VLKPQSVDEVAGAPVSGGVGSPVTTARGSRARDIFREHVPIVAVVLLYCLAGYVAEAAADLHRRMDNVWFHTTYQVYPTLALLALPFAFASYRWTLRSSEGRWIPGLMGWRAALSSSGSGFFTAPRLVGIAVTAVIMPLFLNTYGGRKGMIPDLHPFALHQAFSDLDRIIHHWLRRKAGK
jgi:hypothetical protein